ncbi:hypothetical protein AG1IA_06320 [Rhizoctonia solani AG-1 IA]|uniref:Uncharacterized protein n=1 Tax=Thanatephorus cucumeris (strain AG1-IA) TaxID=983506 RepID=L8WTE1_THACA|nr:hypothetical protein AG1IA_06320 [Rhizoctonia solani AG-1 IA]
MPHFDHSSITVATRRGRLLVITADRWDTIEPHTLSAGLPLDGTLRWAGFALALTALRCTSQSPGAYSPPTRPPPPATALEWQTDTMPIPSPRPTSPQNEKSPGHSDDPLQSPLPSHPNHSADPSAGSPLVFSFLFICINWISYLFIPSPSTRRFSQLTYQKS